jgi:hypothetical protein
MKKGAPGGEEQFKTAAQTLLKYLGGSWGEVRGFETISDQKTNPKPPTTAQEKATWCVLEE